MSHISSNFLLFPIGRGGLHNCALVLTKKKKKKQSINLSSGIDFFPLMDCGVSVSSDWNGTPEEKVGVNLTMGVAFNWSPGGSPSVSLETDTTC